MQLDAWNRFKFICQNHGDDHSHEMILQNNSISINYVCPFHKSIYGDQKKESCNNTINIYDIEWIINKVTSLAEGSADSINVTGYKIERKHITYKVIEHNDDNFVIGILNKKSL